MFRGQFFDGHVQSGPVWYDADGNRLGPVGFDSYPIETNEKIRERITELQQVAPFNNEQFTHIHYSLTEDGKMDVQFAYIPEWDSWPGLYMKGVSQIPEGEIDQCNIPHDIWMERVEMAKAPPYAYTLDCTELHRGLAPNSKFPLVILE